jgi:DNA invertase Pin-like site-specific DNA recombinase
MQEELKKPITRAAIYTRSAIYAPTSLARQQEFCRVVAAQHSWQVDDLIFSDGDKPGLIQSGREGFNSLLQMAAEQPRQFDYLLVESTDRLSRDMTAVIQIVDTLASHGVGVLRSATAGFTRPKLPTDGNNFCVIRWAIRPCSS